MDRKAFLEERKGGIGGSDAAVILGISPFKSPYELWLEKTRQVEAKPAGPSATIGTLLEPLVVSEIVKAFHLGSEDDAEQILRGGVGTNLVIGNVETSPPQMKHPERDYMLAHVDGIVHGEPPIILEAKTAGPHRKAEWDFHGIPPYYVSQVEHYMAVTGAEVAYVGVYFLGQWPLRFVECPSDPVLREILLEEEEKFWQCVTEMRAPKVDGSLTTRSALRSISKIDPTKVIELPHSYVEKVREYHALKAEASRLDAKAQEIANEIESVMGSASKAFVGDLQIASRVESSRRSLDRKRLEADHPDLVALLSEYENVTTFQRFALARSVDLGIDDTQDLSPSETPSVPPGGRKR